MILDFDKLHRDILIKCKDIDKGVTEVERNLGLSQGTIYRLGKGCEPRTISFVLMAGFVGKRCEDYLIKEVLKK